MGELLFIIVFYCVNKRKEDAADGGRTKQHVFRDIFTRIFAFSVSHNGTVPQQLVLVKLLPFSFGNHYTSITHVVKNHHQFHKKQTKNRREEKEGHSQSFTYC